MKKLIIISVLLFASQLVSAQADTVISFDGANDYGHYDGDSLKSAFSVDLYFKDCAMDTAPRTVLSLDGFELAIIGDSASAAIQVKDFSAKVQSVSLTNYTAGNWNHLGVEYNTTNSQVVVLLNGFSITSIQKSNFDWNGSLHIGSNSNKSSHFQGQIDNLRISDTLRLGFIATVPQPPYIYDNITVALWNFDSTSSDASFSSAGDSILFNQGAHPVLLYDDIISQACEDELLSFNFPNSGVGFSAPPSSNFLWNDPVLEWTAIAGIESYSLNFTDSNSCEHSLLLQTEIFAKPLLELGADTILCEGDSIFLPGASFGSHFWSDSSTNNSLWAKEAGTIWLEVIDINSCFSTDTIWFTGLAKPIVDLGNDTTLPRYGTLELDAGPGFASYLWSSFETSQKILATLPDWYKVTVTDSNGCSASDSIYILIDGLFPFGLEEEFKASDIKVFPNPARDVLNVISESSRPLVYWAIVSLEGQLLDYDEGSAERINIALLNSGKYMLWLRSDDGQMLSYPFTKSFR